MCPTTRIHIVEATVATLHNNKWDRNFFVLIPVCIERAIVRTHPLTTTAGRLLVFRCC